ncbi:MAG: helix-hairpin-helix domain-containing protein, partial [Lachnospiraceae bacterium]|nr:helix-hairpin-helix domain-containing protein [Lachnospiraceae bacterium]
GVDLNTASFSLLSYISGISSTVAKNIVSYREANGRFKSRTELKKVAKLGPKTFEQCAGFCRITDGREPLDATAVHPESYESARALLKKMNCGLKDAEKIRAFKKSIADPAVLAKEVGCGEITLADILSELEKPARDPREDLPKPVLRSDVLEMKDLKPGMKLKGTVRNVIDFGAFVDIGVHEDGLVHISKMADRYIKHPLEVVSVGDVVDVTVLEVDEKKGRISLTMVDVSSRKQTSDDIHRRKASGKSSQMSRHTDIS